MKKLERKRLKYKPQPNATPDEIMEILEIVIANSNKTGFWSIYESLSDGAKRHFEIVKQ